MTYFRFVYHMAKVEVNATKKGENEKKNEKTGYK
jgi:hypothetical protein